MGGGRGKICQVYMDFRRFATIKSYYTQNVNRVTYVGLCEISEGTFKSVGCNMCRCPWN